MKSQGIFEYILLLMGVVIVVLLVIDTLLSSAEFTTKELNKSISSAFTILNNYLSKINL